MYLFHPTRPPCVGGLIRWLLCCLGLLYVLAGNALAVKLPDGQRIDTLFYGSGHAHQIQANGHTIADIERDALHREVRRSQGELTLHTGYTPLGQVAWQRASALPFAEDETPQEAQSALWWRYLYDARGEMVETRERLHGRTVYDYDRAGQLQLCHTEESGVERFVWDAAGNLLGKNPAQALPPLLDNLLKRFDGVQYEHDAWGQVTRRNGTTLQWDAEGRLLRSQNRTHQATYRYDALGRRIAQRIEEIISPGMPPGREEVRETQFVWQGMRLAQERETGRGTRTYIYDPVRTYAPVARVDRAGSGDTVWYYHTNPAGTAKMVTDAQGKVVWDGLYGAWGKVLANDGGAHGFAQPLRMPGQYADEVSGLHYNTFRMYDPEAGRFISPDPIGLNGGLNLYQYAPNPIGWIDPLGLATRIPNPDFSDNLFPAGEGQSNTVSIPMQGGRDLDNTQAFAESGISPSEAKGYTWHHMSDFDPDTGKVTMQLVDKSAHKAIPHSGGVSQYQEYSGTKYGTQESKDFARNKGWRATKGGC